MPIIQSAKKALRQSKRRHALNLKRKDVLKKAIKNLRKITPASKKEDVLEALNQVYKIADKVAKTKLIKKNKAARIKSRAAKFLRKTIA